jgi:hypothetical protein
MNESDMANWTLQHHGWFLLRAPQRLCADYCSFRCELLDSGGLIFVKNCFSKSRQRGAVYESFLTFDFIDTPLRVVLSNSRFFFRLQLIDVHRFVSERAFDGAEQLKANQMGAFCAPWKTLASADCD